MWHKEECVLDTGKRANRDSASKDVHKRNPKKRSVQEAWGISKASVRIYSNYKVDMKAGQQ